MNLSNKLKLGTHLRSFYQNIKRNYILCVSSAIINKSQNSILLMKRENQPFIHKWCFPGGKIEKGETYLEATVREAKEETGFDIKIPDIHLLKIVYVGEFLIISSIAENVPQEIYPKTYTHDNFYCKWFDYDEALNLDESFYVHGIKDLIPKAFKLLSFNNTKL